MKSRRLMKKIQAVGGCHPTGAAGGRQPGLESQVERLKEQNRYLEIKITKAENHKKL